MYNATSSSNSSSNVPLSFADLLSTAASDIIDWAPPGKVTTWNQQMQTAAKRSDDDLKDEALQTSARNGDESLNSNRSAVHSSSSSSRPSTGYRALLYRHLLNGLFDIHSQTFVNLYESDKVRVNADVLTSFGLSGFPLGYDGAWRLGLESLWKQRKPCRLSIHTLWSTPMKSPVSSVDVRFRASNCDVAFRADQQLYQLNACCELNRRGQSGGRASGDTETTQQKPPLAVALNAPEPQRRVSLGTQVAPEAFQQMREKLINEQQKRQQQQHQRNNNATTNDALTQQDGSAADHSQPSSWVRRWRLGVGLALKRDLTTGINLFAGGVMETSSGLHVCYQTDVLRRLTASISGPITGGYFSRNAEPQIALRLKMNTITFQGTILDYGISIPGRIFFNGKVLPETAKFKFSHSSIGSMIGVEWEDVLQKAPQWVKRLTGELKVDVVAGVVAKQVVGPSPSPTTSRGAAGGGPAEAPRMPSSSTTPRGVPPSQYANGEHHQATPNADMRATAPPPSIQENRQGLADAPQMTVAPPAAGGGASPAGSQLSLWSGRFPKWNYASFVLINFS